MSFGFKEMLKLDSIESEQKQQIELLSRMLKKQDRQIALLERIVAALENRQDDGR